MKCKNCGAAIPEGYLYCEKCGQEVQIVRDLPALSMRSSDILSAVHREDSIPVPDAVSVLKNFSQEILYVIVPMEGRAVPM